MLLSTPEKLLLILVFHVATAYPLLLCYQNFASCDSGNASFSFKSQWEPVSARSFFLISLCFSPPSLITWRCNIAPPICRGCHRILAEERIPVGQPGY